MIDQFQRVLGELSEQLDEPVVIDHLGACSLLVDDSLICQLELNPEQTKVMIASLISNVSPGKFRENVLFNALKANNLFPNFGTLAFSKEHNSLVFFDSVLLEDLKAEALLSRLETFIEKAFLWKNALESGQSAPVEVIKELETLSEKKS